MDELNGKTGVAHVLEHMMFKGTEKVKSGDFSRMVAAVGGRENAFTARDFTGYFQQIEKSKLADVMRLEADRMANLKFSDEEFLKEIQVVMEERRLRTDDSPNGLMRELMMATAFTSSPYRHPIIGWMNDLQNMKPNDAREWYRDWYAPNNAIVVVVGDVKPLEVRALVEKYYGPISAKQLQERKPQVEPEQIGEKRANLKALADSDDGKGIKPDAALRERVRKLLADPVATRAQMDVVTNSAAEITKALAPEPGAERQALAKAFDLALQKLEVDASLSRADRLGALISRVALARIEAPKDERTPKLGAALKQRVRDQVARDDREISDGYERQAVITSGAYALSQAGLWAESDALLKANLVKSHSPYYLMSQLAGNARKLGRKDEALRWYEQAYASSQGPATRLQWGAGYFSALVELAPGEAARIETLARQLFAEAAKDPAAFHERSARSLQRVGSQLGQWNKEGQHDEALRRLRDGPDGLATVCGRLEAGDAQRATCEAVLKPIPKKA